ARLAVEESAVEHADVPHVAVHVGIEPWLLGDEDRYTVVLDRPPDDGSVDAAFADAGLIADDEALAALDVVYGQPKGVDLLGTEIFVEHIALVAQLMRHE